MAGTARRVNRDVPTTRIGRDLRRFLCYWDPGQRTMGTEMPGESDLLYRVCSKDDWAIAKSTGVYAGGELDRRDGFIHLSSREQLFGTAQTHFAHQRDLLVLCVRFEGSELEPRWEPSRDGQLFPHLYADLPVDLIVKAVELPDDGDGRASVISAI